MAKLTNAQANALQTLTELNQPSTSQDVGTQIKTLQALEKLGLVKLVDYQTESGARECEALYWIAV